MDPQVRTILDQFAPLTLDQLNAKAAMLERLDNKYIVTSTQIRPALASFAEHFDVLEIDGKRAFTYATRYYDDAGLRGYYDHHQGRRKRCKVRVRDYVDAGFSYLEVKLKDKRQVTVKKRLKLDDPVRGLDDTCLAFVDTCHRELYETPFAKPLSPVIGMRYDQITLVAVRAGSG